MEGYRREETEADHGERYTPSTVGELVLDTCHDLAGIRQALEELCAAGLVHLIRQEGKLTRYALTEDSDLQALMRNFYTVYHRADETTMRILARLVDER